MKNLPLLLAALFLIAGCGDDASLLLPEDADAGALFNRYVALGNSITAGFQSNGINVITQRDSYAVLVADQMGTEFYIPALARPGCPPPLVNLIPPEQLGPPGVECALRVGTIPPYLNNVAVPGAEVIDLLTNRDPASNPNPLTTIMLGGRTQLEAAADADPTFVSVWIGNNDVLGAALAGTTALVTPPDVFEARYARVLDSLQAIGVQGGLLIGVANVTLVPHLSPGVIYWQLDRQGEFPPTFDVAANCAPSQFGGVGESTLVPFNYGFGVLLAQARQGVSVQLDCVNDERVLEQEEIEQIVGAVQQYNAFIQSQAQDLGWAYLDPNALFTRPEIRADIPVFPQIGTEAPFGPYFSLDGVHPSSEAHELIADAVIQAINETYGSSIPPL